MSKLFDERQADYTMDLVAMFTGNEEFHLDKNDRKIARLAREAIVRAGEYKKCHLASYAILESGKIVEGLQLCVRRMREFSICAETLPILAAHMAERKGKPDPIKTIATYHAGHDHTGKAGEPYLIAPCPKCYRTLQDVSPNCYVIIEISTPDVLVKIPLGAVPNFRHPDRHRTELYSK